MAANDKPFFERPRKDTAVRVTVLVQPPPIEQRPSCAWCGVKLRPYMRTVEYGTLSKGPRDNWVWVGRQIEWSGHYEGKPPFHSAACAVLFAKAAHAAGYRRSKTDQ